MALGTPHSALLLLVALFVPGCGELMDGSVPVGGGSSTARLRGIVVHAEDPERAFPNARITMRSPEGVILRGRSDDRGSWEFANVPPGVLEITFEGPDPGSHLPVKVSARADFSSFTSIAVALETPHLTAPLVTRIEVSPAAAHAAPGEDVAFEATIVGGNPRRRVPTWVVEGGVGTISPLGVFHAERIGAGSVRAIVGSVEGAAVVTVAAPAAGP
ncbi:MAG: hypothetical protein HY321_00780 [Armatimonadetes bacterium]|nr:hypothetical protein [Armatimonadota bacterium]